MASTLPALFAVLLLCLRSSLAITSCGLEGKKCSMPRDCCEGFVCEEGDWAVSSDYSCRRKTPPRSREDNKAALREYFEYKRYEGDEAMEAALEAALNKWQGREELMFHVLRQKYPGVATTIDDSKQEL